MVFKFDFLAGYPFGVLLLVTLNLYLRLWVVTLIHSAAKASLLLICGHWMLV